MKNVRKVFSLHLLLFLCGAIFLTGCTDPEFEKATESLKRAESAITSLRQALEKTEAGANVSATPFTNIKYLVQYAAYIKQTQPDMKKLVSTLEKEATVQGGRFFYLNSRYENAKKHYTESAGKSRDSAIFVASEATAVELGAGFDVFNDGLVDVINVLADMSKGKLPKLTFDQTSDKTMPPTQHLVGNPAYGGWQRASNGSSFWAWYGQYRLFGDVLGWNSGYRYNQDSWYRSRSPSYYGDVGRHYYGTRTSNKSWSNAARRNPRVQANKAPAGKVKSFKSTSRLSTYAPRTTSSPSSLPKTGRASSYSNTRSSPSSSGGSSRRSFGK